MATTPVDVIKNLVAALIKSSKKITTSTTKGFSGDNAVDEAFKAVGITGGYSALLKEFEESKVGYSQQDFLEEVCSVRLNNADTGAITGSDAGGKTVKTVDSIIPENGAAKVLTEEEYNTFTKNGLKVNISYLNDNTLDKQKLVTRALYNWWLPEALDLIDESLGINFTDGRASINEVKINFVNNMDPAMRLDVSYDVGRPSAFTLNISTNYLGNITDTDKNGALTGHYGQRNFLYSTFGDANYNSDYNGGYHTNYLDRLFLQAFTEMALDANISYIEKMNANVPKGLLKIVGGYDDYSPDYYRFYSSDRYCFGYNYAVLRYLAKNYSDGTGGSGGDEETLPTGLSYNDEKTVLTASAAFTGDKIDLEDFQGGVRNVDASATTRGIEIVGNANGNSLRGGSGNDTFNGGVGNDTLTGGNGNDVFIYDGNGNDVITDYAAGEQIQVTNTIVARATLNGSDVVMRIGNNSLTLKNASGKSVTWTDVNNRTLTTLLGSSSTDTTPAEETPATLLTVTNSTSSPVTVDSAIRVIDATSRTSPVQITGNTSANTIRGGSGNDTLSGGSGNDSIFGAAGNDVLNGDAGNDTLTGGEGNDVFIYDAGNDIITDYATGEQIQLSNGTISNASLSGSDVVMTIGNNTLTVKNGKDKSLTWVDTNNDSHTTLLSTSSSTTSGGSSGSTTSGGGSSSTTPAETPTTLLTVSNSTSSPVTVGSAIRVINATSRTSPVQITGNTRANTIRGGRGNDTLSGGAGNDSIFGAAGNDVLNGDTGNDTLTGGDGNDTLTGGEGTDVFIYDAGNDVITDYATGEQIQLSDGTISNASLSGSDVVMRIGNNTLTVKNGKGKSLTWVDTNDDSHTTLLSGSSSSTRGGSSSSTTTTGNRSSSGKLSNEAFFSGGALRNNSSSSSSSRSTSTRNSSSSGSSGNRSTGASLTSGTTQRSTENNNSKSQVEEIVAAAYSSINAIPADEVANNDADNVYTGGDKIVSNYAGDKIVFGEMYTGSTFDSSGNFFVGSSTGTLTIQDAMDKLVDIVDANGNDFIKAYQTSTAGVIDGRGLAGYEIINGSSTGSNVIFAGDGGSQLWGGSGSYADALVGGNGADIFSGGRFQGADNIFNASSADVVNLTDATLSDIVATVGNNSGIAIGFNTGNVVNIQSTDALSAAVNLADGSSWRYNHVTKGWQSA